MRKMIAALGDSLTLGNTSDEKHPWTARLDADPALYPQVGVANFGNGSDTISGFQTRYTQQVKLSGYDGLIVPTPVNDILNDRTGADTWTDLKALVDGALVDGIQNLFLVTGSPFAAYAGSSGPRQTQWTALRALAAGYSPAGVVHVDLFGPMGDPTAPANLNPQFANADQLHYNYPNGSGLQSGVEKVVEVLRPFVLARYPAAPIVVPPVTITWADVTALATELSSLSLLAQTQVLAEVALQIRPSVWGSVDRANVASLWLARHLGTLRKGGTGVLTSVKVGEVSKGFAAPMSQMGLQSTRYGMEYLRLVRLWLPRFALT